MKKISMFFLICIIISSDFAFGLHPRFRDEFYIENRTNESLVVVSENIGLVGIKFSREEFNYNEQTILFKYESINELSKEFRIIEPGQRFEIGYTEHNEEEFNKLSPLEKFNFFFRFILLFDNVGNLKYRVDNFSNYKIESILGYLPGVFVLVIE